MPELCTRCHRPTPGHTTLNPDGAAILCALCLIVLIGTLDADDIPLTVMLGRPARTAAP